MLTVRPRGSSFRHAAIVAAATAFTGASAVFSTLPASAGDGSPACVNYSQRYDRNPSNRNFKDDVACEIRQIDRKIDQSKANTQKYNEQSAAAREQSAAAREQSAAARAQTEAAKANIEKNLAVKDCTSYLLELIKNKTFTQQELLQKAGGRFDDNNVCPIAKKLGFRGKEALAMPDVR